jgi:hypothetical protein
LVAGKRLGGWRDGFAFARWAGIGRAHGEDVKAWKEGGGCFGVAIGGVRCGNAAGPQSLGASNDKIKKKEEGRAI